MKHYQPLEDEGLKFVGLEFHMEVDNIGVFERLNPDYPIIVFALEGCAIYNVCIKEFAENQPRITINLMLIKQEGRKHYT